jgi:hypothetical protein
VKKVRTAQTVNANTSITKGRVAYRYDGYFPLYRSVGLPANALISNKFLTVRTPTVANTFTLLDIPGLTFWVDGSDSSSLLLSGSNVISWIDKSTNAYNLTQNTSGVRPTFSNNLITFSSNRYLNIPQAALNNATNYGIFFVINPISSTNYIFVKQVDGVDTQNALTMTNYSDSGPAGGTSNYLYWRTSNSRTLATSNSALSTSTLQIIGLIVSNSGSTIDIYKNGTLLSTATLGNYTITNFLSATNFTLGAWIASGITLNPGVTNFLLGEMAFYNPVSLTSNQRQQIEGYLAWKWGLQSSLPTNHLYKNTAP